MFRQLVKKWPFLIGSSILMTLLLLSFSYEPFIQDHLSAVPEYLVNENNQPIATSPYSPVEYPPLGTTRSNQSVFWNMIQGAKYTILFASAIALFRILSAAILTIMYNHLLRKAHRIFEGLVESTMYIPLSALTVLMLYKLPMVTRDIEVAKSFFWDLISIQVPILIFIGIPPLILLIAKEIDKVMKEEYITSAKTLGARGFYLYKKHIFPYLLPHYVLFFAQETVKVLTLLIHLGILGIFIGGAIEVEVFHEVYSPFSMSNEWSGVIGKSFKELMLAPWLVLGPLAFFGITIFSLNLIINSIQELLLNNRPPSPKNMPQAETKAITKKEVSFTFIK